MKSFQIAIGKISEENRHYMDIVKSMSDEYYLFGQDLPDEGRLKNINTSNLLRIEICAAHPDWIYLDNDIELLEPLEMPEKEKPYLVKKRTGNHISNFIISDNGSGLIVLPTKITKHWIRPWLDSYEGKCCFFDSSKYIHH